MSEVEENTVEEEVVSEPDMPVIPLFGKWDLTEVNIVDTLTDTDRGTGGFGSTGK